MLAEDKRIDSFEIEELIMHVLGIDENDNDYQEKIETWLYENYGIDDYESLYRLIRQITPLIDRNEKNKWFAKIMKVEWEMVQKKWLLRIPV